LRKVNRNGLNLIKEFEGCKLKAYQDSVGVWTIGYGHTKGVKRGQVITQKQADDIFEADINIFAEGVDDLIDNDVNDNEFAAIVSLAFNIGLSAFGRSSLLRAVNRGDFDTAANEFLKWNKAKGKVLAGLTRRRKAERTLFLRPDNQLRAVEIPEAIQHSGADENLLQPSVDDSPTQPLPDAANAPPEPADAQGGLLQNQYLDAPKQVLKDNSGKLANWLVAGSAAGTVGGFLKDNLTLIVVCFIALVVIGLSIFFVNKYLKILEAQLKADPTKHDVEFVKKKVETLPLANQPVSLVKSLNRST
jgi:GH24 family phage-related lysozyme (muramidase)